MALVETPTETMSAPCPDFALPDPGGTVHTRDGLRGPNGLVVAFICNHCPYVIAVIDRLAADLVALKDEGVGGALIMPNDWTAYPDDAPDRMAAFAEAHALPVPYLVDERQEAARAFGAVCTPDLFGYGPGLTLQYRGRVDDVGMRGDASARRAELVEGMRTIAGGGTVPHQTPSMGCSIKWR
ncbi:thioredoxin family protein [Jannaschia sp. Os4]|uniref:thioredoxin family protein n=1 Tax=Jannaschia sp. Os4 TaxID=2807617 RepID=UPI0019394C30|nr:thioredoxin family protein [Jannaschia sp. Os4]MBM2575440.1 thioredoxin family protein [Jannaschia sp. Os4]